MSLNRDIKAPSFCLKDVFDRNIDLENYRDKRILIAFFRHAGCPFCNLRVHFLSKAYDALKTMNMEMIFFFESKKNIILRSSFHKDISPIPVISDPEKIWYGNYGLEESVVNSTISHFSSFIQTAVKAKRAGVPMHMMSDGESFSTMPAEFLIDKDLVLKKLHYSKRLNDRLDIEEIRTFATTGELRL